MRAAEHVAETLVQPASDDAAMTSWPASATVREKSGGADSMWSNGAMTETDAVIDKAAQLKARGTPFALVTVVRATSPTSAKPGAKAVVTGEGEIEGWIGGGCAQPVVIKVVKEVLRNKKKRQITINPDREAAGVEGMLDFNMSCHSGATMAST